MKDRTAVTFLPLHQLAHSRAGDKGDTATICVIAYEPAHFPLLVEQVTVEQVQRIFHGRTPTAIRRYVLPQLSALHFVLEGALDGGVNESLNLDAHGKTLSFLLLSLEISVPEAAANSSSSAT
jgi:hypothetical protein